MLFFLEKGEFTEFKKNIVQHIYLLTCNTLRYMEPVAGKPLQGKVLGTFPWFDLDPVAASIISDHKGIYAIIFGKIDKGFLVILYHFRVQAVDLDIKGKQLLRRRNAMNPCFENEAKAILENAKTVDSAGKIDCPILMFVSDGKQVSSGWIEHERLFAEQTKAKAIFLNCGHYIHYYENDRISQEITAFVNQVIG